MSWTKELSIIRAEMERLRHGLTMMGTVTAVDVGAQTATVAVDTGLVVREFPGLPLLGPFIPDVGHKVQISLTGSAPVVLPPAEGVLTTTRGRIQGLGGDNRVANGDFEAANSGQTGPKLNAVGEFEYSIDTWEAGNAQTTIAQDGTISRNGTKSLSLTSGSFSSTLIVQNILTKATLTPVLPSRWYAVFFYARPAATQRAVTPSVLWYDQNLNLLSTSSYTGNVDPVGVWTNIWVWFESPEGAAFARMQFNIGTGDVANAEKHNLDGIVLGEAVPDWDASSGTTVFTFDAGTESWVGDSATLVLYTGSDPAPLAGAGCLQVTRSAGSGAFGAHSPTGTSGIPTTAGFLVFTSVWLRSGPAAPTRTMSISITWYNAGGGTIGSPVTGSATLNTDSASWGSINMSAVAPPTAAFYSIKVATNGGAANELLYIDTGFGTKPSGVQIWLNTNSTYILEGTRSLAIRPTVTGLAAAFTPPGVVPQSTLDYAIAVEPGEYWDASLQYINDAGNATKRSAFTIAQWFAADGSFVSQTVGTYPVTAAGTTWLPAHETFLVPAGVAYMRLMVAYQGAANDIVYIEQVELRRNTIIQGKLLPQGDLLNVSMRSKQQPVPISGIFVIANTWLAGTSFKVPNPMTPVQFRAMLFAYGDTSAAVVHDMRMGISFDNGLTWNYGPVVTHYTSDIAFGHGYFPVMCGNMVTGMPTDTILYRCEARSSNSGGPSVLNGFFFVDILPAPPAGST